MLWMWLCVMAVVLIGQTATAADRVRSVAMESFSITLRINEAATVETVSQLSFRQRTPPDGQNAVTLRTQPGLQRDAQGYGRAGEVRLVGMTNPPALYLPSSIGIPIDDRTIRYYPEVSRGSGADSNRVFIGGELVVPRGTKAGVHVASATLTVLCE